MHLMKHTTVGATRLCRMKYFILQRQTLSQDKIIVQLALSYHNRASK